MSRDDSLNRSESSFHDRPGKRVERGAVKAFPSPFASVCVICAKPLSVHEHAIGDICSDFRCKGKFAVATREAEARRQRRFLNRASSIRDSLVDKQLVPADEKVALAVLPSQHIKLKGVRKRRIRKFVDHLNRVVSRAAAIYFGNALPDADHSSSVSFNDNQIISTERSKILGHCCAMCRGNCCIRGGDHAFLHPDTIIAYMEAHPDKRPRDVFNDYVSRLSSPAIDGSCVYHGPQGCALPRQMRSNVCNGYFCEGVEKIIQQLEDPAVTKVVAIAVTDNDKESQDTGDLNPVREAVIDVNGIDWLNRSPDAERRPAPGLVDHPSNECSRGSILTDSQESDDGAETKKER